MARLLIPPSEFAVLQKIAMLDEVSVTALEGGLQKIEPSIRELDLTKSLSEMVPSISHSDLRSFTRTLAALTAIRENRKRSVEEIVDDINETIVNEIPSPVPLEKLPALLERLKRLLSTGGGIGLVAKAKSVLLEHAHLFCGAVVMSDVRPIFLKSPDEVSAAAIVHTLNISFHEQGQHKEFYAAMNASDLRKLKEVIERAEKKQGALKQYIQKSGVRYLEDVD